MPRNDNLFLNAKFQITIGVLTGVALIFSTIRAGSYYKRNHNGNLSITVLLWFLVYAMGAVGNVITFVCISACVYLFIFYKGQTVPYILLPGDANEKRIQIYISVAFSFKVSRITRQLYRILIKNLWKFSIIK